MSASENEWQRVTANDNKWQRVTASGKTNENTHRRMDDCHFFCDYFIGMVATIRVVK